jgi:hypothetical protein
MIQFLLVEDNGHIAPADSGPIQAGIARLMEVCDSRRDSLGRVEWDTHSKSMKLLQRHFDVAMRDAREDLTAIRGDAFDPGMGMFNPRDLTHRFQRVLEEKMAPLNATECFPVNTEVPPGALHYEQYRTYSTGEAVVYRGGSGADIPEVGLGQASFKQNVVYLVSKASINWLENLRANMTGLDVQGRKMRAARRVIDELENKWTFNGSEAHGLFGLLNHPYIDTALSTVTYVAATSGDDIAADFGVWANYAENESGSTFQPDTLLIAPKLENALRNRKYADDASKSLMDWMLSANPHIKRVKKVRELNDAGGSGIHAMVFTRSSNGGGDAVLEIVKPMMPTLLPPERRTLVSEMILASGFGGLNQREAGDNLVVYVQGEA